jgi:hypothetical protein
MQMGFNSAFKGLRSVCRNVRADASVKEVKKSHYRPGVAQKVPGR